MRTDEKYQYPETVDDLTSLIGHECENQLSGMNLDFCWEGYGTIDKDICEDRMLRIFDFRVLKQVTRPI